MFMKISDCLIFIYIVFEFDFLFFVKYLSLKSDFRSHPRPGRGVSNDLVWP